MQFQRKPYKRHERLSKQIKIILSDMILKDLYLEGSGVITITKVQVTSDLSTAKIFYSVINNELSKKDINIFFKKKSKFIKGLVGKKITSKKIPNFIFIFDNSIEMYDKIDQMFLKIKSGKS